MRANSGGYYFQKLKGGNNLEQQNSKENWFVFEQSLSSGDHEGNRDKELEIWHGNSPETYRLRVLREGGYWGGTVGAGKGNCKLPTD